LSSRSRLFSWSSQKSNCNMATIITPASRKYKFTHQLPLFHLRLMVQLVLALWNIIERSLKFAGESLPLSALRGLAKTVGWICLLRKFILFCVRCLTTMLRFSFCWCRSRYIGIAAALSLRF
jgi:hypothetical protein